MLGYTSNFSRVTNFHNFTSEKQVSNLHMLPKQVWKGLKAHASHDWQTIKVFSQDRKGAVPEAAPFYQDYKVEPVNVIRQESLSVFLRSSSA